MTADGARLAAPPTTFGDFTEDGYRSLVEAARGRFAFEPFGTTSKRPHVLWRHDVDASVHRALALAQVEARAGVCSTWFFTLHSSFYNLLEPSVGERARAILALGHWLGLHFDPSAFAGISAESELEARVDEERQILERWLGVQVHAVSLHNPDVDDVPGMRADEIAGLPNAFGSGLAHRYEYVSDSNGYWRFRPVTDALRDPGIERLHVLTHPEWWVPDALSPRARLERSVEGRARRTLADYDALLDRHARVNVR
jgi:hypothetical protein